MSENCLQYQQPSIVRTPLRKQYAPHVNLTAYPDNSPWLYYGKDNLYPQQMITLAQGATHHSAILKTKVNYVAGDGVIYDTENQPLDIFMSTAFDPIGVYEFMRRTAEDLVLFGGFAWNIGWSLDRTRVVSIHHVPFAKVRIGSPSRKDWISGLGEDVSCYYVSRNWKDKSGDNAPLRLAAFTEHLPAGVKPLYAPARNPNEKYLLYHADYSALVDYYPMPDYAAGLDYIELEQALARFHLRNVQNGLVPTGLFIIPGSQPGEAEQDAHERHIRSMFQGEENAGELIILYAPITPTQSGGFSMHAPTFQPISTNNNADIYKVLLDIVQQQLISTHRLPSPMLAGLPGGGNLSGNANELATAAELFYTNVINGYQQPILESLNRLLAVNQLPADAVQFSKMTPVKNTFSETLLAQILTDTELRAEIGYDPLTPEQKAEMLADLAAETAAKTPAPYPTPQPL